MSKLTNKQCPQFKSKCLVTECAWYDDRLDNCAMQVNNFNLYKLRIALEGTASGEQFQSGPTPFPAQPTPQPAYPGMR